MRSIKVKLIISTGAMILVSLLFVSVTVLSMQWRSQKESLAGDARYMMRIAYTEVEKFLEAPKNIIAAVEGYVKTHDVELAAIENFMEQTVNGGDTEISTLYYTNEVPFKDGGLCAFNIHWTPPADFDQTTRVCFTGAKASSGKVIVTAPYVDTVTGDLVVTLAKSVMKDGRFVGCVGLDITMNQLKDVISGFSLSAGGTSYLLDKDGLYITHTEKDKVLAANFFDDNNFSRHKGNFGSSDGFVDLNAGGGTYLVGNQLPPETGWIFVSTGAVSELFAHVYEGLRFSILIGLVCLAAALFISVVIARTFARPIRDVDLAVNSIAEGNADLTRRLNAATHDEIGELVQGFNKFMGKLHGIVKNVKDSKDNLAAVRGELQESIESTAGSISEILSNIESVGGQVSHQADSVSQTSAAVAEISENISSLERMIDTQSNGVSQASAAVEQMIGNISSVNNSVEKMAASFGALEQNTSEGILRQQKVSAHVAEIEALSKALKDANIAITNVSSQTNLLAMNAAIEAAHAGEAGKGFSVVADEIRKLSETSATESKKISEELRKISEKISAVVVAARESSESFAGVGEKISQTDELVNQIKSAMQEQQEGSRQIVEALKIMNDSTLDVKNASHVMAEGNRAILAEIQNLKLATGLIKEGMGEMSAGAAEMNRTSSVLSGISSKVSDSIGRIGTQIDQFQV